MAIGRWVIACSGNLAVVDQPPPRTAGTRTAADRNSVAMRCAVRLGRLDGAMPLRGEPELLQRFADRAGTRSARRRPTKPMRCGPVEIIAVGVLVVAHVLGQVMPVEAAVLDVALQLVRIGRAAARSSSPSSPRQPASGPMPGRALVVDDVVGIAAGILRRAVRLRPSPAGQPRAEVDQHRLEAAHVAVGLDHRLADRSRPAPSARRSAGRAARCSRGARDRSCRAG